MKTSIAVLLVFIVLFAGCKREHQPTPQERQIAYVEQLKSCGKDQRMCFTECVPEIQHNRIRDVSPRCLALSVALAKDTLSYPSNVRALKEEMVGGQGWSTSEEGPFLDDDDIGGECRMRWHGRTYKCVEEKSK